MHLLFLLPFFELCCFTNQVKRGGKGGRTDSTQRILRRRPLPPVKSSRIFFSIQEGRERERDEWAKECRRQTSALGRRVGMLERLLFFPHKILQGVDVNMEAEREEGCKKSHLRDTCMIFIFTLVHAVSIARRVGHTYMQPVPIAAISSFPPPPSFPSTGCIGSEGQDWKPQKTVCVSVAWFLFQIPPYPLLYLLPFLSPPLSFSQLSISLSLPPPAPSHI